MKKTFTLKRTLLTGILFLLISFDQFAQLSGFYTIGGIPGPTNFVNFSAAVTALNTNGVGAGGATLNVASGAIFNETPLTLNISINPPSVTNPLVFQNSGLTPTV